jgi:hypothetical protein
MSIQCTYVMYMEVNPACPHKHRNSFSTFCSKFIIRKIQNTIGQEWSFNHPFRQHRLDLVSPSLPLHSHSTYKDGHGPPYFRTRNPVQSYCALSLRSVLLIVMADLRNTTCSTKMVACACLCRIQNGNATVQTGTSL